VEIFGRRVGKVIAGYPVSANVKESSMSDHISETKKPPVDPPVESPPAPKPTGEGRSDDDPPGGYGGDEEPSDA
jgi:hypothetical protein